MFSSLMWTNSKSITTPIPSESQGTLACQACIPDIMYFLPEEFGKVDCLKDVSPQKLNELKVRLDSETDVPNTVWEDYYISNIS